MEENLTNWERLQKLFPGIVLRQAVSLPSDEEPIVTQDPIADSELREWAAGVVLQDFEFCGELQPVSTGAYKERGVYKVVYIVTD